MNHDSPTGTGLVDPASNTTYRMGAIPLSPAPTTSLAERARLWRLLRDSPWFEEDGKILAARRSERAAKRLVSLHHSTNFGRIFSNKRVPRDPTASAMGRYELDLLVITPRRVVNLEIKNWSGKLRVQRDKWVQQRRDGSELAHDNLLSYNRDKLLAVRRYLQHCGVTLLAAPRARSATGSNQRQPGLQRCALPGLRGAGPGRPALAHPYGVNAVLKLD